jgi:hypothetical protein
MSAISYKTPAVVIDKQVADEKIAVLWAVK